MPESARLSGPTSSSVAPASSSANTRQAAPKPDAPWLPIAITPKNAFSARTPATNATLRNIGPSRARSSG